MKLRDDAAEQGPDPTIAMFAAANTGAPVVQDPEIAKKAREGLAAALAVDRDNRKSALEAQEFISGKQWSDTIRKEREDEGRPVITVNRLPQFVKQVTGDIRRNRPSIQCTPGDGAASPRTAQVYEGMIRSIERASGGQRIYSRAADQAAQCGMGHFRLVVVPAGPKTLDKDLEIQSIRNPFSVLWGRCQKDDKSDAKECWVAAQVPKKEFEAAHPGAKPVNWMNDLPGQMAGVVVGDIVTLCEYWKVDEKPVQLVELAHDMAWVDEWGRMQPPTGAEVQLEDPTQEELGWAITTGWRVVRAGEGFTRTITQYLFAGETLLKQTAWPGDRIPIFTVLGEEVEVGEKTVRKGLVTDAMDAQRLLNVARSGDAEAYGLAPKVPWVVADEQIEGYENEWRQANKRPLPYLRYKILRNDDGDAIQAPKPQREPAVGTNPATLAMAASASDDMKAVIGIYDASLGARSNETSGVAIDARDRQADTGTFVYVDNLMTIIEALGREIVVMIPHVYSSRRQIRILGKDDAAAVIQIAQEGIDLNIGKYDVIVQTGPAHATARKEAAAGMLDLAKIVPPQFAIELIPRIAKLQDWQDADELGERFTQIAIGLGMIPPPAGMAVPGQPPGAPGGPMPPGMPPGAPPQGAAPPGGPPNIPGIQLPPELLARIPPSPGAAPAGFERVTPRPFAGPQGVQA